MNSRLENYGVILYTCSSYLWKYNFSID